MKTQADLDDRLGNLVHAAFSDNDLANAHTCCSPEWWYDFESGFLELTTEQEQTALSHSESCTRCSTERQLARSFVEEQRESEGRGNLISFSSRPPEIAARKQQQRDSQGRPGGSADFRRRSLAGWLAAAAVVLATVGTYSVTQSRAPSILPPGADVVMRSQIIEAVQPTGNTHEPPTNFSWIDRNALGPYRVIVTRVDGRVVLEGTTEETFLVLSEEQLADLEPAVRYHWTVEATTPSGATVVSLPLDFRITP